MLQTREMSSTRTKFLVVRLSVDAPFDFISQTKFIYVPLLYCRILLSSVELCISKYSFAMFTMIFGHINIVCFESGAHVLLFMREFHDIVVKSIYSSFFHSLF